MKRPMRMSVRCPGFALPMVIIAIAGLTLILVGLVTVLNLEGKTARSYSNVTRADLAVESGLAIAIASLTEIVKRDDSIVFRLEDPVEPEPESTDRPLGYREQFFTYGAIYEQDTADLTTGTWRGIPLFSGVAETALGSTEIEADKLSSALTLYLDQAEILSTISEYDQNIPRGQWVEIPSASADGYTFRYAYWVEDLSGRIDGRNAGTLTQDKRTSTAELDFATVFDPENETPTFPAAFSKNQEEIKTPASIRGVLGGGESEQTQAQRIEPYIHFYDLSSYGLSPKVIPQGFGYQSAGEVAEDLSEFVSAGDVDGLALYIGGEMPLFEDRKGGFPASEDYLKTIAASIIDYADTDTNATVGTGYRGIDSYPFVNEVFDRYEWVSSPLGIITIEVETYLEVWNLSDKSITGDLRFENINNRKITLGGNGEKNFTTATFKTSGISIPANGFRVISLGVEIYDFPVDIEPAEPLVFNSTDSDSSFELYWNEVLIDKPKGGVERTFGLLRSGLSARKWKGNSSPPNDISKSQYGDPRVSFYINENFFSSSYSSNSSWGGRSLKDDIDPAEAFREVRLEQWPDRGSNSTKGVFPGTDARIPTETGIVLKSSGASISGKEFPGNQPELAPARISNTGEYESLIELGSIFDPAQWANVEASAFSADQTAGGGITLAIGRPEYAAFDQQGKRAAQLLDLFSLEQATTSGSLPININTAPREVLRSLISNVTLDEDPIATELEIEKKSIDPRIGDIFADQVIAHRNKFPLRSISDLNLIREDPVTARDYESIENHPFFGNTENYTNEPFITARTDTEEEYNQADFEEWNDSGREELLGEIMNLVSYRSNLFRIIVAGEALAPSGKSISRSTREFHYGIFPERGTDGLILEGGEVEISKFYETSH